MASPISALRRRLYQLAFIDEFVPFLVLYTLWFDDNQVSVGQISVAFIVWSVAVLVLEVPSGALADRVDRRRLLGTAFAVRIFAVALWLAWPTFTGLLVGALHACNVSCRPTCAPRSRACASWAPAWSSAPPCS